MSAVFLGSQGNPSPGVLLPPDGPWPLLGFGSPGGSLAFHPSCRDTKGTVVGAGGTASSSTLGLGL